MGANPLSYMSDTVGVLTKIDIFIMFANFTATIINHSVKNNFSSA